MKAFPTVNWAKQQGQPPNDEGMDLRDYFAAKAMQAIINNSDQKSISILEVDLWIGNYAYTVADAMMEARKQ
jgi:hypothetical protein